MSKTRCPVIHNTREVTMAHSSPPLRSWRISSSSSSFTAAVVVVVLHLLLLPVSANTATYIVHMDKSAMPSAFVDHHAWYASTLSSAGGAAGLSSASHQMLYAYDHAMHGFSARLSAPHLEQLKSSPGFLSAYGDFPVKPHTTHTPEFLGLNPAAGVWPASHYGEGAIIGVVDSGVWPESRSYGDEGMPEVPSRWRGACEGGVNFTSAMCNRKLIGARYYDKGFRAKYPDLVNLIVGSARDTDGHGTLTSSIAAGNYVPGASYHGYGAGTAKGVAPRAHLAVYKVMWTGTSSASDVLAGIDQAVADGVDVLSVSFGLGSFALHQNPLAIASFAAMEKGIFVANSAGNEGPNFKSVLEGIPWSLTVGATTVDRVFAGTVVLGDGTAVVGGSLYTGKPPSSKPLPLVQVDCQNSTALAQSAGKIVACQPIPEVEDLSLMEYYVRTAKGVAGGLFLVTAEFLEYFSKFSFPATLLGEEESQRVLDYMKRTPNPTATLHFRRTILGAKPAPVAALYSSRGPSPICPEVLKPDLVAPGSLVLASSPGTDRSFDVSYGSSLACPHAAGVAAMLKVLHPDWSPAAIRSAMVTTANPLDNAGAPIPIRVGAKPASPLAVGSGQLDPNRAADPGLVYDAGAADYVGLLCAMNYTEEQIGTIVGSLGKHSCAASPATAGDLNYPSFIAYFDKEGSPPYRRAVREFRRTVTNVAEGAWTYTAKVVGLEGLLVSVRPRRLAFGRQYEKQGFTLRVENRRVVFGQSSYPHLLHGSLTWVDETGKHVVRSPIVATTHDIPDDDSE